MYYMHARTISIRQNITGRNEQGLEGFCLGNMLRFRWFVKTLVLAVRHVQYVQVSCGLTSLSIIFRRALKGHSASRIILHRACVKLSTLAIRKEPIFIFTYKQRPSFIIHTLPTYSSVLTGTCRRQETMTDTCMC